jgi:hypothetical protein
VQFKNGSCYEYEGVTETTFNNFRQADSVGKYFSAYIGKNYPYKKVDIIE